MAYSDPQSLPYSTPRPAVRVGMTDQSGTFQNNDSTGEVTTLVITQNGKGSKKTRQSARLTLNLLVDDPLVSGRKVPVEYSATFVVETPQGMSALRSVNISDVLLKWLSGSSNANLIKLINYEV